MLSCVMKKLSGDKCWASYSTVTEQERKKGRRQTIRLSYGGLRGYFFSGKLGLINCGDLVANGMTRSRGQQSYH